MSAITGSSSSEPSETPSSLASCGTPRSPARNSFTAARLNSSEYGGTLGISITDPTQLVYVDEGRLLADAVDPSALYRELILPRKMRSDLDYVARGSVRGDLQVLWRTGLLPLARVRSAHVQVAPRVGAATRSSVVTSLLTLALGLLFGVDVALG